MKTRTSFRYLCSALLLTIISLLIYVSVQQSYRTAANDPQIAIATEINSRLTKGESLQKFFEDTIDIQNSLLPFITIYDSAKRPVRSSGKLSGEFLKIPSGVFNNINKGVWKSITTQPQKDVRLAMVILRTVNDQYITVGRSLLEVEKRETALIKMISIAWIIMQAVLLLQLLLVRNRELSN